MTRRQDLMAMFATITGAPLEGAVNRALTDRVLEIMTPRPRKGTKAISVAEFRKLGFVQEVNRRVLHPAGLALAVDIEEDGLERFGAVWDYRDDPEGMLYGTGEISADKILSVNKLMVDHTPARLKVLGDHTIQEATDRVPLN